MGRFYGEFENDGRWAYEGEKVKFLGRNGYDFELKAAMKEFEVGEELEVVGVTIHSSTSDYKFKGHEGRWNTVMFSDPINRRPGSLTFDQLKRKNSERCQAPDGFNHPVDQWSLSDWMTGLIGEIGEAANLIKKLNRVRDGIKGNKETVEELRDKLGRELADAQHYLILLSVAADVDLEDYVRKVFNDKSIEIGAPHRL